MARHGGEEFAALMTGVSKEMAARYAEELRQACAAKEILGRGLSACVTISIGLAECNGERDLVKVMRMADQALYAAKRTQSCRAGGRPDGLYRGLDAEPNQTSD